MDTDTGLSDLLYSTGEITGICHKPNLCTSNFVILKDYSLMTYIFIKAHRQNKITNKLINISLPGSNLLNCLIYQLFPSFEHMYYKFY